MMVEKGFMQIRTPRIVRRDYGNNLCIGETALISLVKSRAGRFSFETTYSASSWADRTVRDMSAVLICQINRGNGR